MKIIKLLNKIANGEDVPKKIKYGEIYCYYRENRNEYVDYTNKPILNWDWIVMNNLNGEVEILEEEKEIPEKLEERYYHDEPALIDDMAHKINEIIDYLKSKGE